MKKFNALIPKEDTDQVGFSPINSEVVLVITNPYFGRDALDDKIKDAADSLKIDPDEVTARLKRVEEVRWPIS